MDPLFGVLVVLVGAVVGFAAGLLGIGGGMILAPLLARRFCGPAVMVV